MKKITETAQFIPILLPIKTRCGSEWQGNKTLIFADIKYVKPKSVSNNV